MPWNAQAGAGELAPGIPRSHIWASAKKGIDQVGCAHAAQGFEFDYVGVILGPDLVCRPDEWGWIGQLVSSHDRVSRGTTATFTDFVKGAYRVLLTRGLHGCCVCFMDIPTRDFVLCRCEHSPTRSTRVVETIDDHRA